MVIIDIIVILLLIVLNGYFALSEIAVVSAKKTKLEAERKKGSKGAEKALQLQSDPDNFLSAVQVGITLIGIINGAYGGATLSVYVEPFFERFTWSEPYAYTISLVIVVFLITYVSIVIGELVPKTAALNNPEKVAVAVSRSIGIISIIFYPFVKLLAISTSFLNRLIGLKPKKDSVTEMELRAMLKNASNEGVIDLEENIIHEQIFYFSDKRSIHIMTHRTEVEWVNISVTKDELIKELLETKHSKILACNNRIDDFVGVISMRNFLMKLTKKEDFTIDELIFEPLIVPATLRAQKVLESMKKNRQFMAVVVDEYGSLEGIITLHDIFENILGSIPEETDTDTDPLIFMRNEYSALISGEAPIELISYLDEDFIVDFDEIDYSTVAGFVFSCLNKIPSVGDHFVFGDLYFEVMDIDNNRIDKVLVTNIKKEKEDSIKSNQME